MINGPVASGKSTVARELAGIAERSGCRSGVIDLDELWFMLEHQRHRDGSLEKWLLARHAAAALTDLFYSTGIEVVVIEGPFFTAEERAEFTRHLRTPVPARFVTLSVSFDESLRRVQDDPHPGRVASRDPAWLRVRHVASTELLVRLRGSEPIIDTDGRTAAQVAAEVASATRFGRRTFE